MRTLGHSKFLSGQTSLTEERLDSEAGPEVEDASAESEREEKAEPRNGGSGELVRFAVTVSSLTVDSGGGRGSSSMLLGRVSFDITM